MAMNNENAANAQRIRRMRDKILRAYGQRAHILKALAHPGRLMMIEAMNESGEICVLDLVEMVGSDQSTVSKHLGMLKHVGLVTARKEGQHAFYSLNCRSVMDVFDCVERVLDEMSETDG